MSIDLQIECWPIERLIPRANNPRTHSPAQMARLAASMLEFGFTNPILVGAGDDMIAGHAWLLAARKLGMSEVPVIVWAHLSEAQRRAFVIADNQLALNSGWDEEALRIELTLLQEAGYNLDLVGFDDVELARLLEAQEAAEGFTDRRRPGTAGDTHLGAGRYRPLDCEAHRAPDSRQRTNRLLLPRERTRLGTHAGAGYPPSACVCFRCMNAP